MTFISFELESQSSCNYDHLRIYNGPSTSSPVLGTFCGTIVPSNQITDGRDALIHFKSDGSVTRTGFLLAFDRLETGKSNNIYVPYNAYNNLISYQLTAKIIY